MSEEVTEVQQDEVPAEQPQQVEEVKAEAEAEVEDTTTSEETPEDDGLPKPKEPKGVQKRINELTREKYEAKREAEFWRQQAEQFQQKTPINQQEIHTAVGPEPTLEQYGYDEAQFKAAYREWNAKVFQAESKQRQSANEQFKQMQEQARFQATLAAHVAEGASRFDDFEQVISNPALPSLPQINEAAFQAVVQSDKAPEILYYLAKNPNTLVKFAEYNAVQAIREIAKLEVMFEQQTKPQKQKVTSAPPPPKTVGGKEAATKSPEQWSVKEHMEHMAKLRR